MAPKLPRSPKPARFEVGRVHVRPIRRRGARGPQDGRWYWRAHVNEGGGQRTIWSNWATRDEAERSISDLVARDRVDAPRVPASQIKTVRDLLEVWGAAQLARGDTVGFTKRNQITCAGHVIATIGHVDLRQLGKRELDEHRDRRMATPRPNAGGQTVRKEIKILRAAWKWGQEQQPPLVPDRSLPRVEIAKAKLRPRRSRYTPTPAEVAAVLEHLRGWARIAVLVMDATGARVGEVAGLTWPDVDLVASAITFNAEGEGKTGARRVPIGDDVRAELAAWRASSEATSRHPGIVLGVKAVVVRAWLGAVGLRDACKAAGVPRFSPHGLRRAMSRKLRRAGVDVGTYTNWMGHSAAIGLKHYNEVLDEDLVGALEAVERPPVVETPPPGPAASEGVVVAFDPTRRRQRG